MHLLTPKMQQTLKENLEKYHDLFDSGRCSGWQLDELIYKSIQSNKTADYHATWREEGPDDHTNVRVWINGEIHPLHIRYGEIKKTWSGHQRKPHVVLAEQSLVRFRGDLKATTKYLNEERADFLSVHYHTVDDNMGRYHIYQILYLEARYCGQLNLDQWKTAKSNWKQINPYRVIYTVYTNNTWRVWWQIPLSLVHPAPEFVIKCPKRSKKTLFNR